MLFPVWSDRGPHIGLKSDQAGIEPTYLGVSFKENFGLTIGNDAKNFYILLEYAQPMPQGKRSFVITDEIVLPFHAAGKFSFASANSGACGYNGKMRPDILGYYERHRLTADRKHHTEIRKAWRVDLKRKIFVEVETRNLSCEYVTY